MAKFCVNCGTQLPDGTAFCTNCGTQLPVTAAPQPEPQPVQQPAPQYQPQQQYYQQPQGYYPPAPAPAKKSGKKWLWAVIALVVAAGIAVGILFLTGVLGGDKLPGTWISNTDDVMVLNGDGTGTLNGANITYRTNDGIITITLGSSSYSYTYKISGDNMLFYEDDRNFPTVSFTRGNGETPRSSDEPEPSSSEPEPSSSEPEPEPEPVPDFEELGITPHLLQPGIERTYVTGERNDDSAAAVGTLCVDSYVKGAISDEALAFLQDLGVDLTGYTSRKAKFTMSFPSGVVPGIFYEFEDYYDITTYDGYDYAALDEDRYWYETQVEINGVKKSIYIYNVTDIAESEAYMGTIDVEVIVPDGYDGFCYAFIDSRIGDDVDVQSEYFNLYKPDNILFFRFS
ncbi:MAG: zinc ribbon domain-containing protein [Clostridia bacterium]|nr:zinc ribbon domain-containing protein [Clostridia bacterium]